MLAAYGSGLNHGAAAQMSVPAKAAAAPDAPPRSAATAAALALMLVASLGLAACSDQTAAQKTAAGQAIASGLLCLANASGKVVATVSTSDPTAVKAVNAAIAAGNSVTTDTACQAAIASGAAALPTGAVATP